MAKVKIAGSTAAGAVAAVYKRWHEWAAPEVAVGRLAGHSTEKQTADYIRHEAESAIAANLPAPDVQLVARVEELKEELFTKRIEHA